MCLARRCRTKLTERIFRHDLHLEGWRRHGVVQVGLEAGVQTARHLLARNREGRLSDGMVFRHEVELDHVANLGVDGRWRVDETFGASDGDLARISWRSHGCSPELPT